MGPRLGGRGERLLCARHVEKSLRGKGLKRRGLGGGG